MHDNHLIVRNKMLLLLFKEHDISLNRLSKLGFYCMVSTMTEATLIKDNI